MLRNGLRLALLGMALTAIVSAVRGPASAGAFLRPKASLTPGTIVIPVVGIQASTLRDTFRAGRAGHVHHAIDILAPRGTPVVAAVDGTIRKLFTSAAGGITIYETDPAGEMIYYYAHLDRYADGIVEGQSVRQGDVIGYVGTTGNAPAHTPHLHFAITILPPSKEWWKGDAVNPYPILMKKGVTLQAGGGLQVGGR